MYIYSCRFLYVVDLLIRIVVHNTFVIPMECIQIDH